MGVVPQSNSHVCEAEKKGTTNTMFSSVFSFSFHFALCSVAKSPSHVVPFILYFFHNVYPKLTKSKASSIGSNLSFCA
ncbi:hypothetical protein RJT34_15872 [Clitoria ternatea]|uniref:Uncharacterized protein n=1 Tax=Clitoria ternatea TaxID=43366 RepID=A0AAN9PD39_CLITE